MYIQLTMISSPKTGTINRLCGHIFCVLLQMQDYINEDPLYAAYYVHQKSNLIIKINLKKNLSVKSCKASRKSQKSKKMRQIIFTCLMLLAFNAINCKSEDVLANTNNNLRPLPGRNYIYINYYTYITLTMYL